MTAASAATANGPAPADARQVRCQNPYCPSARYGRPALICIIEAPVRAPLAVRTRCRRCKSFQRIELPPL